MPVMRSLRFMPVLRRTGERGSIFHVGEPTVSPRAPSLACAERRLFACLPREPDRLASERLADAPTARRLVDDDVLDPGSEAGRDPVEDEDGEEEAPEADA